MQSIYLVILNPVFFVVFFGTSASCLLVVITALSNDLNTGFEFVLAGDALSCREPAGNRCLQRAAEQRPSCGKS